MLYRFIALACVLTALAFSFQARASALLVYPFQKTTVIRTERFDIVSTIKSRDAAVLLASFADKEYARIADYFSYTNDERIVVALSADSKEVNGWNINLPYTRIVLLTTPPDGVYFGSYGLWLRTVFIHELTHAVSLNRRTGAAEFLSKIFGNWVSPNLAMPWFMIEGVTVSLESMEGMGRVNSPSVRSMLRQDILENSFKDIAQAAGPYARYPGRQTFYHYGGLFSAYLQKKYGFEPYFRLWSDMGGNFLLDFGRVFRDVYGITIEKAWEDFRLTLVQEIEQNGPVYQNPDRIFRNDTLITALEIRGNTAYYFDAFKKKACALDLDTRTETFLFDYDGTVYSFCLDKGGSRLLVNSMVYDAGLAGLHTREFDLDRKAFTGRSWQGLRGAFYFEAGSYTGVAGVEIENMESRIVLYQGGFRRILASGRADIVFDSPRQYDDKRVAFIVNELSNRSVALLDVDTGTIERLDIPGLVYAGSISVQDKAVRINWAPREGFPRTALVYPDQSNAAVMIRNYNGGVADSFSYSNRLYYLSAQSGGVSLFSMPQPYTDNRSVSNIPVTMSYLSPRAFDTNTPWITNETDYSVFPYLLPRFWIPDLSVNATGITAFGFTTLLQDPLEVWQILVRSVFNWNALFMDTDISLNRSGFLFDLWLRALDTLRLSNDSVHYVDRVAQVSGGIGRTITGSPLYNRFSISLYGAWTAFYTNAGGNSSAYTWPYATNGITAGASVFFGNSRGKYQYYDYEGWDFSFSADYNVNKDRYRLTGFFSFYPGFIPVSLSLSGGYTPYGFLSAGGSGNVFSSAGYRVYGEYLSVTNQSIWLVNGQLEWGIASFDIENGWGLVPAYINRLTLRAGLRGLALDGFMNSSAYARMELNTSLVYRILPLDMWLEYRHRLDTGAAGIAFNYSTSISF